jgi:hypothetical protein
MTTIRNTVYVTPTSLAFETSSPRDAIEYAKTHVRYMRWRLTGLLLFSFVVSSAKTISNSSQNGNDTKAMYSTSTL